ncbi:MAG: DUF1826 domain-containing protein [Alphaproteobacteria bacterium]|nr:DUF1826 domain-containing protein [Alphaproteobacteria bacterium]MCW5738823.1 DUF1826 domain-containing protein [Alphaproteobacteria bacterium]
MSAAAQAIRPHVACGDTPAALSAITSPAVNLALWQRRLPRALEASVAAHRARPIAGEVWFDACDSAARTDGHFAVLLRDIATADQALWRADIEPLVGAFARLSAAHVVRATLETVTGAGCRKFHVDHVGLRLLCTYDGGGTQWLPDAAVRRGMLAVGDNDNIVADARSVETMARGDVGLFKGEAWPGNAGRGIVHRSPPPPEGGHRRVLLCLDAGMVDHSRLGRAVLV